MTREPANTETPQTMTGRAVQVIERAETRGWNAALAAVEEVIAAEQSRRMDPASGQISTRRVLSRLTALRKGASE
jgi:hypothetical protein